MTYSEALDVQFSYDLINKDELEEARSYFKANGKLDRKLSEPAASFWVFLEELQRRGIDVGEYEQNLVKIRKRRNEILRGMPKKGGTVGGKPKTWSGSQVQYAQSKARREVLAEIDRKNRKKTR